MNKGDTVIPTKNWGSNVVTITKGEILEVYDFTCTGIDEFLIKDLSNNKELLVYSYEITVVKTSADWAKEDNSGILVVDPDGWDRNDYEYSYYQELITNEEYEKRKMWSTCMFPNGCFDN